MKAARQPGRATIGRSARRSGSGSAQRQRLGSAQLQRQRSAAQRGLQAGRYARSPLPVLLCHEDGLWDGEVWIHDLLAIYQLSWLACGAHAAGRPVPGHALRAGGHHKGGPPRRALAQLRRRPLQARRCRRRHGVGPAADAAAPAAAHAAPAAASTALGAACASTQHLSGVIPPEVDGRHQQRDGHQVGQQQQVEAHLPAAGARARRRRGGVMQGTRSRRQAASGGGGVATRFWECSRNPTRLSVSTTGTPACLTAHARLPREQAALRLPGALECLRAAAAPCRRP